MIDHNRELKSDHLFREWERKVAAVCSVCSNGFYLNYNEAQPAYLWPACLYLMYYYYFFYMKRLCCNRRWSCRLILTDRYLPTLQQHRLRVKAAVCCADLHFPRWRTTCTAALSTSPNTTGPFSSDLPLLPPELRSRPVLLFFPLFLILNSSEILQVVLPGVK